MFSPSPWSFSWIGIILSDLRANAAAFGNTMYLQLGGKDYEYSRQAANGSADSFSVVSAS